MMLNGDARIVVPLRLLTEAGPLNLISTTTVFGTALDVTLSELAVETFFPADRATAELLVSLSELNSSGIHHRVTEGHRGNCGCPC